MGNESLREIDDALDAIEAAAGKSRRQDSSKKSSNQILGLLVSAVKVILLLVFPFLLLVRSSVFLYLEFGWNAWISVGGAVALTSVVMMIYVALVSGKLGFRKLVSVNKARFSAVVVIAYCLYALVYVSSANTKTSDVRSTYTSLHPIVRIAVASIILVNKEMVITDAARTREDYRRMGLPPRESSLHFEQEDGFVHAVDIRTRGVSEWKNAALAVYFRVVGFHTLRHVGTADHLHVSLPVAG